jgi:hypothetical protein
MKAQAVNMPFFKVLWCQFLLQMQQLHWIFLYEVQYRGKHFGRQIGGGDFVSCLVRLRGRKLGVRAKR